MSDTTPIEWTDATWNPTRGCSRVSEGCRNCYAERTGRRFAGPGGAYAGLVKQTHEGPRWTGTVVLDEDALGRPLKWRRGRRVFVDSMSDLFHEALSFDDVDRVFAVMALARRQTFQVLTKRPQRMRAYMSELVDHGRRVAQVAMERAKGQPAAAAANLLAVLASQLEDADLRRPRAPPNVWLGVSVEDQRSADERVPELLETPAALRFVSYEPALERIDLRPWLHDSTCPLAGPVRTQFLGGGLAAAAACTCVVTREVGLDWVIVGGESGPRARPFDPDWALSTVLHCREANVPCFVKQLGALPCVDFELDRLAVESRNVAGRDRCELQELRPLKLRDAKGGDPLEWPAQLRVREFPT